MKIKYPDEVIICQSSITLLKYIEKLVEFEFYNPIHFLKDEKEGGLELPESYKNCFYLLDYYVYFNRYLVLLYLSISLFDTYQEIDL